VRSSDEDKSLRDDGNLEVDDHVSSGVSNILDGLDTESVLEEVCVVHDDVKNDGREGEVETVGNGVAEDLGKVPVVGSHRGQDSVEREGHDGSVVLAGHAEE
jgi:hypothetical protein